MTSRGHLRLTTRMRTWLDLGTTLSLDELVIIGDHLVREPRHWAEGRDRAWVSPDEMDEAARAFRGDGARKLRNAMQLVRVGADSPAETRLRLALHRAGVPPPQLNRRVVVDGVDLGEPDLSWPQWRVCVEHDGEHHRSAEQQRRDIRRRELREQLGWTEVQTVAADLRGSCVSAVRRVSAALVCAGWGSRS